MRTLGSRASRRPPIARAALLAAALVATTIAFSPLQASASTAFERNLVRNGGAEARLASWETFGDLSTRRYGDAGLGFPSTTTGARIGGGLRFFHAGAYDDSTGGCGDGKQELVLAGIGAAIDSGHVRVRLRGYAGTNGADQLNAHLDLYFRDARNHTVAINGITRTVSSTNEHYTRIRAARVLPRHTRILLLHIWADGDATVTSQTCQAFWDRLSVVLERV